MRRTQVQANSNLTQIQALAASLPALLEAEITENLGLVTETLDRLTALSASPVGLELIQVNKIKEALVALLAAKTALHVAAEPYQKPKGPVLKVVDPAVEDAA